MKMDIRETINKVLQFGGRFHAPSSFRGVRCDADREAILQKKCDALGIAPVMEGELD
jgi:hypothetical protein